jgi:ribosomal protein S18 acetylase RimI-like enzyme
MTTIRKANESDLDSIAALAEMKRIQYEAYQPVFHRRAPNALKEHRTFLKSLLNRENTLLLVAQQDAKVLGFVFVSVVEAPRVYDPQGKICFIDDFMVEDSVLRPTVGRELAQEAFKYSKQMGTVLANVVCGPMDTAKKALLRELGFDVASEWHVRTL